MAKRGKELPRKPRKITLECNDVLWLLPPIPHDGDELWCTRCKEYRKVGAPDIIGETFFPDYMWRAIRHPVKGWWGECVMDGCPYPRQKVNRWFELTQRMESHYMREHTNSTLITRTEVVPIPKLPRNSKPPF